MKGLATTRGFPVLVLVAGAFILTLSMGIRQSFGLFLAPMTADLGWSREVFALAIAVQNLIWGLVQPFAGMVADKYGTARTLAGGGILYVAGLLLMAVSETPLQFHFGAGVVLGLAVGATGFPIVLAAVGRAVPARRRSMALGIAAAGGSFGQFAVAPVGQILIDGTGWATALVLFAVLAALLVPLAAPLAGRATEAVEGMAQTLREALREATRHSGFIYLTLGFFVCGFHVAFIATHLPVFITGQALPAMVGAIALGLIGFFNIIGTWLAGWLGGRYRKKYLLSAIYLARAGVFGVFFLVPPTETTVYVFAAAIGLLWLGTVPLTSGVVGQIFGVRYLATLFGIVMLSHQVGAFLGAWLGGVIFDRTGSYDLVWILAILLGLAAAALHWPIADRPVARLAGDPAAGM